MIQKFFELLYRVSLKGMNFGQSEVSKSGERYVLKHLLEKAGQPFIIFDVGANKGQYANLANEVFADQTEIFSFEPSPAAFRELAENTSSIKNIHLNNYALGASSAETTLYYDVEGSGLASIYPRRLDHFNIDFDKTASIKIRTLDDFCKENNVSSIDLLKLDVEGHELEVLKGAKNMLEKNVIKNIQFEFGGANIDSRTYFQDFYYLLKDKYRLFRILRNGLQEIDQYVEWQEIFITVNYLAQLK